MYHLLPIVQCKSFLVIVTCAERDIAVKEQTSSNIFFIIVGFILDVKIIFNYLVNNSYALLSDVHNFFCQL